ncbi:MULTISPECIES: hypothetical protein [unclassified Caballeronia]
MKERRISVAGETRAMPDFFLVLKQAVKRRSTSAERV